MTRASKNTLVLDGNTIKFRLWDEGSRLPALYRLINALPDCDRDPCSQAAALADQVAEALGSDFRCAGQFDKGHDFYKHRWPILRNEVECGWVGFLASSDSPRQKAQAETLHVNLFGAACTFAAPGWRDRVAAIIDNLGADITRADLALDFFDGFSGGIECVWSDYQAGLCDIGGRRFKLRDINWCKGSSRSLYIGSKEAGKETNVYEKGDQLFGEEAKSKWLRFELRYGNKLRVIQSDLLRRPDDFFLGASDWHAAVLREAGADAEPASIKVNGRLPQMSIATKCVRNARWAMNTAAATVTACFKYLRDDQFINFVSSFKKPRRLEKFSDSELHTAFASAFDQFVTSEPGPVPV